MQTSRRKFLLGASALVVTAPLPMAVLPEVVGIDLGAELDRLMIGHLERTLTGNPAWVLRDMMMLFGPGHEIDMPTIQNFADYCFEMVPAC